MKCPPRGLILAIAASLLVLLAMPNSEVLERPPQTSEIPAAEIVAELPAQLPAEIEKPKSETRAIVAYELGRGVRATEKKHSIFGDVILIDDAQPTRTTVAAKLKTEVVAPAPVAVAAFVPRRAEAGLFAPMAADRVTQAEINTLKSGVAATFTALERQVVDQVFAETYPLIGKNLGAAWSNNVAGLKYLTNLQTAIVAGLNTLTGQADYATTNVASAINTRLTSAGFAAGSMVVVTMANGPRLAFATLDTFSGVNVPLAKDLGLPNLRFEFNGTPNGSITINANFQFVIGVDGGGFYLEAPTATFALNTTTTVSQSVNAGARFNAIPYIANDVPGDRTSLPLNFEIALRDPNNSGGDLRTNELGGDLLDATVTGTTKTALRIASTLPPAAQFPQIRSDLKLRWTFEDEPVDPFDNNAEFGARPELTLDANAINLESFFDSFAVRAFRQIDDAVEPFADVIEVLTAEIPLLSDLGSDAVTILDVVGVDPAAVDAIQGLNRIATLASVTSGFPDNSSVFSDLGAYLVSGDLRVTPLEDLTGAPVRPPSTTRDAELNRFITDAANIRGLRFPLLTDETVVAKLLLGRPATLFTYDTGEIGFSEDFKQFFPVLGPIGITLGGKVGLTNRFGFGYDSYGITEYFDKGANDPSLFANGFYAMAADEQGLPVTGITLSAGITAGIELNLGLVSAGVEGDLTATIGIYLNDQIGDGDGRIRGKTIASTPLDDLFYAAGSLSAGLRAYVDVGIGPFAVSYDIESPRVVLITYDSRDPETPVLAEMEGGTLVLNVGDRAHRRLHGDKEDRAEEFMITNIVGGISVSAFNHENEFGNPILIVGNAKDRGDVLAVLEDVQIPVQFTGGESIDILTGGAAGDILEGGLGPDKLRGNGGNDVLRGGIDNDELNGGSGDDELDGGDGLDLASWDGSFIPVTIDLRTATFGGAAEGDRLISIERYAGTGHADGIDGSEGNDSLLRGLGGNDIMRGHGGDDLLEGGGGADDVQGGAGNDMIVGGSGGDTLDGGPGTDVLSYLGAMSPVTVSLLTATGTGGDATGDVLSNFEILMGSGLPREEGPAFVSGDDLEGSDNGETIFGMDGTDVIRGMGGNDIIYGNHPDLEAAPKIGFDADKINGGAGNDQIFGQGDNDELDGGDGVDALKGGSGDDHLITFDALSVDVLDGEAGTNRLSADYSDKLTPFIFTVGTNNAHVFPDGDEYQNMQTLGRVNSGSANDVIRLAASQEQAFWNKHIDAGPGDDLIIADYRGIFPGLLTRTSDTLAGGEGNDTVSFEQSIGAVTISLGSNGTGGAADEITISGFENIIGSNFPDNLNGDTNNNIINPLLSGSSGADIVNGGGGDDILRVDFSGDPRVNAQGISVTPNWTSGFETFRLGPNWDLNGGPALVGYVGIERFEITGGDGPDRIYGDGLGAANAHDRLIGRGGNDILGSGPGNDYLDGGEGNDDIRAGVGSDIVIGGPGNDIVDFEPSSGYGSDFVDAGTGDDTVRDATFPGSDQTSGNASTRFRFDGGSGIDTLQVDLGYVTTPMRIDDSTGPIEIPLPNDGYVRGFERLPGLTTGTGNDYVVLTGRFNQTISLRAGNDIINPGIGVDSINGGLAGDDLIILDYSVGDDADAGPVVNIDTLRHERRSLSSNAVLDSILAGQFERFHFTGTSKNDVIRTLDGPDVLRGMGGNDTLTGGNGNDFLDGGAGADSLRGETGNDTYIVDDVGDVIVEASGTDTVRSTINFILPSGTEHLDLIGAATIGTGNTVSNRITGNMQNNILRGEAGNDVLDGAGVVTKIDRLNGGAGADTFVLGDGDVRYYDDLSIGSGHSGYVIIEDFLPSQTDRLRLTGNRTEYLLGSSPITEAPGSAIYHDSNANGTLEPSTDELIAVLVSVEALTLANTVGNANASVDPAIVGLDQPLRAVVIDPTAAGVEFVISETLPANVTLEIQSSIDLGENYPWQVIATKTGANAWTGAATATVSAPQNGKVAVTVRDVQPLGILQKNFFRARMWQQ